MLAGTIWRLPTPLEPTATSVRVREGKRLVTDGPFAETREQLGGYYLIDASDLDEAIDIAARIPGVRWGTVEIRPVMEIPGLPEDERPELSRRLCIIAETERNPVLHRAGFRLPGLGALVSSEADSATEARATSGGGMSISRTSKRRSGVRAGFSPAVEECLNVKYLCLV